MLASRGWHQVIEGYPSSSRQKPMLDAPVRWPKRESCS
jgi:hypothetical protein